jgi:hypothetical protein
VALLPCKGWGRRLGEGSEGSGERDPAVGKLEWEP